MLQWIWALWFCQVEACEGESQCHRQRVNLGKFVGAVKCSKSIWLRDDELECRSRQKHSNRKYRVKDRAMIPWKHRGRQEDSACLRKKYFITEKWLMLDPLLNTAGVNSLSIHLMSQKFTSSLIQNKPQNLSENQRSIDGKQETQEKLKDCFRERWIHPFY